MTRRCLAFALLVLLLISPAAGPLGAQSGPQQNGANPTIANADLFGKSVEAAQETIEQYGRYDNAAELARINRIGYELAQQSGFQKFPFTFDLVDMPEPNAVSLPAGQIFIFRGLLDLGLDDDMLACVVGHEIGHVVHEHYLHMSRRATLMNILSTALMAGVMIAADRSRAPSGVQAPYDPRYDYGYGDGHGNMVQGAAAASLIVSELLLRSYSRENEDEADLEGQHLAAAAGYDPDGARRVWVKMNNRSPQIKEYGYLQTHPFNEARVRAAEARKGTWRIAARGAADEYRRRTQKVLLDFASHMRVKEPPRPRDQRAPSGGPGPGRGELAGAPAHRRSSPVTFLKEEALAAWPVGKAADEIRLEKLHELRGAEMAKAADLRDYGALVRAQVKAMDEVRRLDPKDAGLAIFQTETADLEARRKEAYPRAVTVLAGGVYETGFLVAFLSNFPEAKEAPQVALALGDAYSRLGKESEAVAQYLAAWKASPDSGEGKRARAGLRNLAPNLKELAALEQLAEQEQDAELKRLASSRLAKVASSYEDLANGAEYLRRYPAGEQVVVVLERLNVLADNLYGEVVLYQGFGDAAKAIERINKILTQAPLSPAAERLRDHAVLTAEKRG